MANRFEFQVVALDRYTKTFKNLNDKASKATRPLAATGRQFKALGKELHIDKIAKGFEKLSRSSIGVAQNLGLAAGPLQSLFGLTMLGGVGAAAAGVGSLAARFADLGSTVGRSASLMNVSSRDLQRFQGAAKLTNLSVDDAKQSLDSFGRTLHDVAYGGNATARDILAKLGVQIRKNKDGTVDAVGTLEDYSRAISKISDPRTQQRATEPFGMQAMIPLLKQGPDAIRRLSDEAERLGVVIDESAIKKADKFTESLNRLNAAADGVANTVGQKLSGPATKAMDALTGFITPTQAAGAAPPKLVSKEDRRMLKAGLSGEAPSAPAAKPPSSLASPIAMPPGMVEITLGTESGGRRYDKRGNLLTSPAGAQGEMQVMPKTNKNPGYGVKPAQDDSPEELARVGRDYLGAMFKRYGDPAKAWAAYNAGPGALDDRLKASGDNWLASMPRETQNYVTKNMAALARGQSGAPPQPAPPQAVEVKVRFENAPRGVSATTTGIGSSAPTRVSYAMPTDGLP